MQCRRCGQTNPEGFRFCGACGSELAPPGAAREVRKTVTVLFCDVSGSTAMGERLDAESTRRVMSRYFDEMRATIERHGGTVEKFIGDAVMAVFGIPVVHEDDALRAVRAAVDMRRALTALNDELEREWGVRLDSRIGINTGEVVAGEGASLATGDAVNVAARLEQGAAPGETLLGEATHRLLREAVVAEPIEPLAAKGKSEPVPAVRLVDLVEGGEFIPRRLESPLVGRQNELAQLQRAYDHAVSERVAYQFTLLGPAGIGKSRLVRELQHRLAATFLAGRCLPYGEGITYSPLAEIAPLASELDLGANREEIALRTRRILEGLARQRPLVIVFEDLQWAEPTFLDLVDHLSDYARDAPMLILCVARPELLDVRPGWGGGKLNATTMLLEALTTTDAGRLVDNLIPTHVPTDVRERIAVAAGGNPLFVEEMLAMAGENVEELAIPPTIQALLAARLDRLTDDERTTVECAAIQGEEFRLSALATLLPDAVSGRVGEVHQSLIRKDLFRPTGDDASAFKHVLLRDAAYEGLPKERRADLHRRFASHLEETEPDHEEIRGYHLERAYRYLEELGPVDERGRDLAREAAALLAAAGRRAFARADVPATINLLERATRLLPEGDRAAVGLYPDLAAAIEDGGDLERAHELYVTAESLGDEATSLRARLRRVWLEGMRGAQISEGLDQIEAIWSEAERLNDGSILAETLVRLGALRFFANDGKGAKEVLLESLGHAEAAADARHKSEAVIWLAAELGWGSTPIDEALEELRRLAELGIDDNALAQVLAVEGALTAFAGDFDGGRKLAAEGLQTRLELGRGVQYGALTMPVALVELHAGDAAAAERILRKGQEVLQPSGERGYLSTVLGMLALAVVMQGRVAEADALADESRRAGSADDVTTQIYWRVAKARVAAEQEAQDAARRLAAEVVALSSSHKSVDTPLILIEIAELLPGPERRSALEYALATAEAKGNVVSAERARAQLAALP